MHKIFVNLLCLFVPSRQKRHELRRKLITKNKYELLMERFYALNSLIKAQTVHKEVFEPYKGVYSERDVVLVSTGPTLNDYEPIKGAIHIGVNSAFKWKKGKLDYLFFQDGCFAGVDRNNPPWKYTVKCINDFQPEGLVKFYGIAQHMLMEKSPTLRIPLADLIASGAKPYILEDPERNSIAYDLSYEPMGTYASVTFSALQFAMYTNPKRLYIVGSDCTDVHFNDEEDPTAFTFGASFKIYEDWKLFKNHIDMYYPELEVISINPVGLRGLFKDMYTAEAVDLAALQLEKRR